MTAMKKPATIESVRLSSDQKEVFFSLIDRDPEVAAFARAGGLGEDSVAGAKRIVKVGVLAASIGAAQCNVAELQRAAEQMAALSDIPEQVAKKLAEAVGAQLNRVVGDNERPGALRIDAIHEIAGNTIGRLPGSITKPRVMFHAPLARAASSSVIHTCR
jgi:hypothetical protein